MATRCSSAAGKGDRCPLRGPCLVFESKSLQTATVAQTDDGWVFEFEKKWRFAVAKNQDLPASSFRGYSEYQRSHLLATMVTVHWPPQPPFHEEPFMLMEELLHGTE